MTVTKHYGKYRKRYEDIYSTKAQNATVTGTEFKGGRRDMSAQLLDRGELCLLSPQHFVIRSNVVV